MVLTNTKSWTMERLHYIWGPGYPGEPEIHLLDAEEVCPYGIRVLECNNIHCPCWDKNMEE